MTQPSYSHIFVSVHFLSFTASFKEKTCARSALSSPFERQTPLRKSFPQIPDFDVGREEQKFAIELQKCAIETQKKKRIGRGERSQESQNQLAKCINHS